MDQEKLNELLDILIKQLSAEEFKYLVFKMLGPGASSNLPGDTQRGKAISFMERVCQRQAEDMLLKTLAEMRTDIELSQFGRTPERKPAEPAPTPFISFANRKVEWEKVVLYPEGQYYLFEGPAGYGKTALLNKLDEEFKKRKWFCVYVSLREHNTVPQIANHIAQQLQVQADVFIKDPRQIGVNLGRATTQRWEIETEKAKAKAEDPVPGLVLLLDIDHEPRESLIPTLQMAVQGLIPGVYDGLTYNSDYFRATPASFRVVIAGRYLTSHIEKFKGSYNVTQLKPFDYEVVRDICKNYIQDASEINEFAANLLFNSGGHPRCMVRTLQKFEKAGVPPNDFFSFYREEIEEIAHHEAIWVRISIMRDWRGSFDSLCVYRRLDHFLLRQLLDEGLVWHGMVKDEYDLADKLKLSYLMDWADELRRHLSDDITRRLLDIQLRCDVGDTEFRARCNQAERFCLKCLDRAGEYSPYWAVEALFEYLQGNVARINDETARQAIRQQFFETKVPEVLHRLVQERDPRLQKRSLCNILNRDWEFQFTLNYYLRADHYDETPYQEMLKHIEQFCEQFC